MKRLFPLLLLTLGAAVLARFLLVPGLIETHDGIWHIERILGMARMLKDGYFPVRYVAGLDNGFGLPVFNYVYPLPYYLGAIPTILGLGVVASYKLLTFGFYLMGGVGVYLLLSSSSWYLGLSGSLLYLSSSYMLLDLLVRGALGEIAALGIFPYVLLAWRQVVSTGRLRWYSPLPVALLLLSHNFLGLILTFCLLILMLFERSNLTRSLLCLLVSLMLSAFFLLPMLGERTLLMSPPEGLQNADFAAHYVYPLQLVSSPWGYTGSLAGADPHEISFELGLGLIATLIAGIFVARGQGRTALVVALGATFMSLNLSYYIWDALPTLKEIQFSWRLLAVPLALSPLILISISTRINTRFMPVVATTLIALCLVGLPPKTYPSRVLKVEEFQALHNTYERKFASAYRYELTPRFATLERESSTKTVLVEGDLASPRSLKVEDRVVSFELETESPAKVKLERNYFPFWVGKVDGQPIDLTPGEGGEITFYSLPGDHHYQISVSSSPLERVGDVLTLLGVFALPILGKVGQKATKRASKLHTSKHGN